MTDPNTTPDQAPGFSPLNETLPFPPDTDKPIIRIPLKGVADLALEMELDRQLDDDPEVRVEGFLRANSTTFRSVNEAWDNVRTSQKAFNEIVDFFKMGDEKSPLPRDLRRRHEKIVQQIASPNVTFGTCKHEAARLYPMVIHDVDTSKSPEEQNEAFTKGLSTTYEEMLEKMTKDLDDRYPESIQDFILKMLKTRTVITISNVYARYRQEVALAKIESFLAEPDVAPAFAKALQEEAATNEQLRQYPGLLDLMATHIEQARHGDNMLQKALERNAPAPETYSHELLQMLDDRRQMPKELAATFTVMDIAAGIIESEFSMTRADFIALFAEKSEQWPTDLKLRLQTYAADKLQDRWKEIKSALAPFVRVGRLPAEVNQRAIITPPTSKRRSPREQDKAVPTKAPKIQGIVALASTRLDHSDVVGTRERQPIEKFAILKGKPDKAGMRFELEEVDDLEELFLFSNLEDYIERHKADQTLRPLFEAAIDHLRKDPTDPAHTVPLKNVEYIDVETGNTRKVRRFSPQSFPAIAKGEIAAKTRIIYDVVVRGGQRVLVVYGAFIKGDIEHMDKLPKLR